MVLESSSHAGVTCLKCLPPAVPEGATKHRQKLGLAPAQTHGRPRGAGPTELDRLPPPRSENPAGIRGKHAPVSTPPVPRPYSACAHGEDGASGSRSTARLGTPLKPAATFETMQYIHVCTSVYACSRKCMHGSNRNEQKSVVSPSAKGHKHKVHAPCVWRTRTQLGTLT